MSEQSRERFEAWALKNYATPPGIGRLLVRAETGDGYRLSNINNAWHGWQASRQAVEVELPSRDRIHTEDMAYYHADVCSSIESCGLRVKA